MATWNAMDGKTYTEREIATFPTEREARNFCTGLGAHLVRERMSGAIYRSDSPTRRALTVTRSSWSGGFAVLETFEVTR